MLVEQFTAAHRQAPAELVLDTDASDIPLHGEQELKEFRAYYDQHSYLPPYVYCGQPLLPGVLRRSRIDGARHAASGIKLLIARLREVWPTTRYIVRADSGFCCQRLIRWCEGRGVGYVISLARNARLHQRVAGWERLMEGAFARSREKQHQLREFHYSPRVGIGSGASSPAWSMGRKATTLALS